VRECLGHNGPADIKPRCFRAEGPQTHYQSICTVEKVYLLLEIRQIKVSFTGIIITAAFVYTETNVGLESTLGVPQSLFLKCYSYKIDIYK
jgi:hypothetical protein